MLLAIWFRIRTKFISLSLSLWGGGGEWRDNRSFCCEYFSGLFKVDDKKLEAIMAWIFKFLA